MSRFANLFRSCLAKGMSPQDAADIVEMVEEGFAQPVPAVDPLELRRAADRERKARHRERQEVEKDEASRDGHVTGEDKEASPTPPQENTPIPPLKGGTFPKASALPEKPKSKPLSVWVAEIWEITPRPGRQRSGRPALERSLRPAERRGVDLAAVKAGVAGYYASEDATKNHGQYAQGVHVVVSSGRWEAFAADEPQAAPADEDPWPSRLRRFQLAAYWNSEWGPKPGKPGYRGPLVEGIAA